MATVTAGINRSGICSNFGNCSLADKRETVEVTIGMDFVCTECGKPLLLKDGGGRAGGGKTGLIVAAVALVLLLAGGAVWLSGSKKPEELVTKPAPIAPVSKPAPGGPAEKPSGNCSPADEKAGLCKMQR